MSPARVAPPEEEPTPERVDFVADAIVAALADIELFDDFADAGRAARAAILADAEFRSGARS